MLIATSELSESEISPQCDERCDRLNPCDNRATQIIVVAGNRMRLCNNCLLNLYNLIEIVIANEEWPP